MPKPRRPANFNATVQVGSIIDSIAWWTENPLDVLDIHEAWDEVDWKDLPHWIEDIKRAEAQLHEFRLRLEALHSPERVCAACGTPIAGRVDRRYCSSRCRVTAHRDEARRLNLGEL